MCWETKHLCTSNVQVASVATVVVVGVTLPRLPRVERGRRRWVGLIRRRQGHLWVGVRRLTLAVALDTATEIWVSCQSPLYFVLLHTNVSAHMRTKHLCTSNVQVVSVATVVVVGVTLPRLSRVERGRRRWVGLIRRRILRHLRTFLPSVLLVLTTCTSTLVTQTMPAAAITDVSAH